MVTVQEFSASIKAKYPQYANVDDSTLASKMIEKYPQYKDKVTFENPQAMQPKQQPSVLNQAGNVAMAGLEGIGNIISRVSVTPINAGLQYIQQSRENRGGRIPQGIDRWTDPQEYKDIGRFAKGYFSNFGVTDPSQVPTSKQTMENYGVSPKGISNFIPEIRKGSWMDVPTSSVAGIALDVASPIPLGLITKSALGVGKGLIKGGAGAVDLVKGTTTASDILKGTKQGLKNYGMRKSAMVNEVLNPKLASDVNEINSIGKKIGLTDDELMHPALQFGENSTKGREFKVMAQGEGGQPFIDKHNIIADKVKQGLDKSIENIGGKPLAKQQAGELIRQGVLNGADRIHQSVTMGHSDIIDMFPNLKIGSMLGREAEKLNSILNGIEKFAKGRAVRGVVDEQTSAASSLLKAVNTVKQTKGSYKQLNEARQMIGDIAFKPIGAFEKLPTYQQKMRDLYFGINDALIGTVDKLRKPGEQFADQFTNLKQELINSNETLHNLFKDENAIGRALGLPEKASEKIYNEALTDTRKIQALKNLLSPEEFSKLKASYLHNILEVGKRDNLAYKTAKNKLFDNKSVLGELFIDNPQQLKDVNDVINLGDRLGANFLPGSAGQLDFGGANSFSKFLANNIQTPIRDVTSEIGKVRAYQKPVQQNKAIEVLKNVYNKTPKTFLAKLMQSQSRND